MTSLAPRLLLDEFPDESSEIPRNVINANVFKMGSTICRTKSVKEKSEIEAKKSS